MVALSTSRNSGRAVAFFGLLTESPRHRALSVAVLCGAAARWERSILQNGGNKMKMLAAFCAEKEDAKWPIYGNAAFVTDRWPERLEDIRAMERRIKKEGAYHDVIITNLVLLEKDSWFDRLMRWMGV